MQLGLSLLPRFLCPQFWHLILLAYEQDMPHERLQHLLSISNRTQLNLSLLPHFLCLPFSNIICPPHQQGIPYERLQHLPVAVDTKQSNCGHFWLHIGWPVVPHFYQEYIHFLALSQPPSILGPTE